ncbi:hypothetical protein Poli38472_007135 [Pythium oligandrum]|uniref:NAD(P)-binding protein n=1 Tax=Pythium oligandrum TaxID=41045 RepID=A0A8K1C958_PYTOL|nr:hypothetical protein Poli38472_007134 [Pythium oligandrum]TMW58990.1 hypothetical protein Poli38472_007135 [Pythium oligandrum]|eukprot:TMW58989.1 hypothetical protein Poli38472_007134 [Pythium oligandrum]
MTTALASNVTNNKANTVLITGSSRGIGLALATYYHAAGWNVIGAARNPVTADKLKALNVYKTVQLDVVDEASILRAAKDLEGEAIDLLINNAGICPQTDDLFTDSKADLLRTLEVNAVGPFLISRTFLPHLKAAAAIKGYAKIAQISSTLGSITLNPGEYRVFPSYRISKAALNMANSVLMHQIKADNIIAVTLCPGYVATEINDGAGLLEPSVSASMVAKVIGGVTLKESGKYYNHEGTELPW